MIFAPSLPIIMLITAMILLAGFVIFCAFNKKFRKAKVFRRAGIVALLLLALMRPAIGTGKADRELSNLNLHFIVDNTGSMATRDMDNGEKYRFEKAAADMKKIVSLFPGAKYSIYTIDYGIYQAMPLISNMETANSYIETLKPKNSRLTNNSSLSELLSYSYEHIKKYSGRFPERANLVFFLSDGEDANGKTAVPNDFGGLISGGAVIGYGTATGGEVHEIDYNNEVEDYALKDPVTRSAHISKLDESNMKAVATTLGINYYRRSSSNDKFSNNEHFFGGKAEYHGDDRQVGIKTDLYWIPMLFAIGLLLFDFLKILESLLLERKAAK